MTLFPPKILTLCLLMHKNKNFSTWVTSAQTFHYSFQLKKKIWIKFWASCKICFWKNKINICFSNSKIKFWESKIQIMAMWICFPIWLMIIILQQSKKKFKTILPCWRRGMVLFCSWSKLLKICKWKFLNLEFSVRKTPFNVDLWFMKSLLIEKWS